MTPHPFKEKGILLKSTVGLAMFAACCTLQAAGFLRLNEIVANPPGSASDVPSKPESQWEFIELIGSPDYDMANHYVVVINGDSGVDFPVGTTSLVVPLSGTVPASGMVFIKQAGHPVPIQTKQFIVQANQRIPVTVGPPSRNTNDELIANGGGTILLVSGANAPLVNHGYHGSGSGNGGVLNAEWTALGLTIVDSIAWRNGSGTIYAGTRLRQVDGQPDAFTRIRGLTHANTASDWSYGCIGGAPSTLAYSEDLNQRSGSMPGGGGTFMDPNCFLTPGVPNEPFIIPAGDHGIDFIRPFAQFISPNNTPFTGDIQLPIVGVPSPASITAVFSNNPPIVDWVPTQLYTYQSGGSWILRLKPSYVVANRLINLLPDDDWSRARTLGF